MCLAAHEAEFHWWTAGAPLGDFRNCQTFTASPAEPGDLPWLLDRRFRGIVQSRFNDGGLLPPASFRAVANAIRELSPSSRQPLDRFSEERESRIRRLPEETRDKLAFQKETVATALAFAGIDKHVLEDWIPPPDESGTYIDAPSFLDGLPYARMREDPMIEHDMRQVPGFEYVRSMQFGAAVFEKDNTRLTVINANRSAIEGQFGADLVYFNETYQSFVMIQYKAMESDYDNKPIFRLPNEQLNQQIKLMKSVLTMLADSGPNKELRGFRIMENPFFLKLCPRFSFNPNYSGLVKGMYLALDYWYLIESEPSLAGSRGGRQITFDNVGRTLNNSEFIQLMTKAWVGTTPSQSRILKPLIKKMIETNRPFTIAVKVG